MGRVYLFLAAFFGFTGVALGAFAAHGLRGRLTAAHLEVFQTGVHYQQIHALALLAVVLLAARGTSRLLAATGLCFSLGIVLFSGSLYLMTLAGLKLGLVTPLGGVLFLIGWACLGLLAWRRTA
ncbi:MULTISPECIES: DUF423 domain-containing protein [Pseudomonas]|uniref:Membrane protein n=1 Tax=Pseudomonas flexibilis TaxID=706570 RepID=A0A0B2D910_9PSED|nr:MULTISPECIES: DUF423 domain-containing protein [Pseudomonas]KHL69111.1 membrane protein [Pseudomonas flexibilis]KHO64910.1 membrane protein [Pseudomonas flexibilis]SCX95048.1 Uncharacterized membrane protein YgdD, TMEM256/DUF423 family [Pseudomonas flexibilis]SIR03021.1 Uncharacterized membrane protein YgdD, TMEM256/DUF423 family [Pseudomonas flexibilis]